MRPQKKTYPTLSKYHTSMCGTSPKTLQAVIEGLANIGYTEYYLMACVRATKSWDDRISGSKTFFATKDKPTDKPGDVVHYTNHIKDRMNGMDQKLWIDAILHIKDSQVINVTGVYDIKSKRTYGIVIDNPYADIVQSEDD